MSGSPKATTNTPSSPTARTSCAAAPATTPRSWYAASSPPATTGHAPPPGRRKHRPRGGSPRPGTQPLRPPRPRRSIQADGLPALARGNPGTGGRAAALDRPTHRSRPQPRSGPRLRHRPLVVEAFDRTAFLPRPLDGWAPVPVFGRGRNGLWSRLLRSRSETAMRSMRPGWVMVGDDATAAPSGVLG
jgi:hypothetical protein